jgi:hypothetical protein
MGITFDGGDAQRGVTLNQLMVRLALMAVCAGAYAEVARAGAGGDGDDEALVAADPLKRRDSALGGVRDGEPGSGRRCRSGPAGGERASLATQGGLPVT